MVYDIDPCDVNMVAIVGYCLSNGLDVNDALHVDNDYDLNACLDYIVVTIVSELQNRIVLKGGYLLEQLLPGEARQSHDVDFSIGNKDDYIQIKDLLKQIAEYFIECSYIKSYKIKDDVYPTMSGGIDMYDSNGVKMLGVDISLHEITYGVHLTQIKGVNTYVFDIERILSDKFVVILSRKRFRRPKDLYDFYIITNTFDFSLAKLRSCILKRITFEDLFSTVPFTDTVLKEYRKAFNSLNLESITGKPLPSVSYENAIERVSVVLIALQQYADTRVWYARKVGFMSLEMYYPLVRDRDIVTVGDHALAEDGLTTTWCYNVQCSTGITDCIRLGIFPVYYYTMDSWNDLAYTRPSRTNPLVHVPTKERALVEAMKYEYFNEGILIESLITYMTTFYNKELLEEVADHFKLPRKRLQYWLDEAEYDRTHDES